MHEGLLLAGALAACVAGMGWLALSMEAHWEQVRGTVASRAAICRLRVLGALGLACALALCLWVDHPSMAVLVWVMSVTAAALAVALTLTWRPRWLLGLAWVAGRGMRS